MKKHSLVFTTVTSLLLFAVFSTYAQAPEGFTYQAEARDMLGRTLPLTPLTVRATIVTGASASTATKVWTKDYPVRTDAFYQDQSVN